MMCRPLLALPGRAQRADARMTFIAWTTSRDRAARWAFDAAPVPGIVTTPVPVR